MASAAVKERLNRLGQGVLQPAAGLAALAAILRASAGLASLASISPAAGGITAAAVGALAGADAAAVVTVNPWKWRTYLQHMQVRQCGLFCGLMLVSHEITTSTSVLLAGTNLLFLS
jgi:hypothetical protein